MEFKLRGHHVHESVPGARTQAQAERAENAIRKELYSGKYDRAGVWSKRRIRTGEQIAIDYGPAYFDEHIRPKGCRCPDCRPGRDISDRPGPTTSVSSRVTGQDI